MKKIAILLFSLTTCFCSAQSKSDIINPNTPIVWLGFDFSKVQLTKKEEFTNLDQILRFFADCNKYLKDVAKYNQVSTRLKRDVITDFSFVNVKNELVDWHQVYSDNVEYLLSDEIIQKMLEELKVDQQKYKDNIGLVFCEENMSKTKSRGMIAIVFFRINDLKPILIKHVSYKPQGFGFLNYWCYPNLQAMWYLRDIQKELK